MQFGFHHLILKRRNNSFTPPQVVIVFICKKYNAVDFVVLPFYKICQCSSTVADTKKATGISSAKLQIVFSVLPKEPGNIAEKTDVHIITGTQNHREQRGHVASFVQISCKNDA